MDEIDVIAKHLHSHYLMAKCVEHTVLCSTRVTSPFTNRQLDDTSRIHHYTFYPPWLPCPVCHLAPVEPADLMPLLLSSRWDHRVFGLHIVDIRVSCLSSKPLVGDQINLRWLDWLIIWFCIHRSAQTLAMVPWPGRNIHIWHPSAQAIASAMAGLVSEIEFLNQRESKGERHSHKDDVREYLVLVHNLSSS
jgi:hypothetical protein